ncbi:MAG: tetratricopeptide repeat protein [Planctomycetota bacterium]
MLTPHLLLLSLLVACPAHGLTRPAPAPGAQEESAEEWIQKGRVELDAGRAERAEEYFTKAHAADGGAFESRAWILRAWMEQGRSNDTLDALDAEVRAGRSGPLMDYLFGMAFARRALSAVMSGTADSSVQMNFGDAVRHLVAATEAEPARFADAFLALATSAWYAGDLEVALRAAHEAVQRYPKNGEANSMLGRIALSTFQVAHTDAGGPPPEEWDGDVMLHWTVARDAFADAVTNFGKPKRSEERLQNLLSQAAVQLGHTWVWKGARDEAAKAYGTAIGWAPDRVNLGEVRGFLTDPENPNDLSVFRGALERGQELFQRTFGKQDARNASLWWWLGYARYWSGQRAEAETAFLAALELEPGFTNSWVYVALARYDRKDFDGALTALRAGWDADPVSTIAELSSDASGNANRLRFLIGHAFEAKDLERAAFAAEVVAEVTQNVSGDWNNLGLFLRDRAEALERNRRAKSKDELALIEDLYERAYRAYLRSLDLSPEDPQVLNDTAVMLHYYLKRDLDEARAMYVRAGELADAELAKPRLAASDRERFQIAKRDAVNNLRALEKVLAEARREKAKGTPPGDGNDGANADQNADGARSGA